MEHFQRNPELYHSNPYSESIAIPLSAIQESSFILTGVDNLQVQSNIKSISKHVRCTKTESSRYKPYICFIPLPYCQDPQSSYKPLPPIHKFKMQGNSFSFRPRAFPKQLPPIDIPIGETPINEYLDYVLTQEINVELRDAKVLAEEVKRIKQEKKKAVTKVKEPSPVKKATKKRKHKLVGHSFLFKIR